MNQLRIGNYAATREQVRVHETLRDHDLFALLVHRALESHASSDFDLPNENEEGERVQQGARLMIREITHAYFNAAQSMRMIFPRQINVGDEYFPYMVLRAKINGRLPKWIENKIKLNDGVIPETWEYSDTSLEYEPD